MWGRLLCCISRRKYRRCSAGVDALLLGLLLLGLLLLAVVAAWVVAACCCCCLLLMLCMTTGAAGRGAVAQRVLAAAGKGPVLLLRLQRVHDGAIYSALQLGRGTICLVSAVTSYHDHHVMLNLSRPSTGHLSAILTLPLIVAHGGA